MCTKFRTAKFDASFNFVCNEMTVYLKVAHLRDSINTNDNDNNRKSSNKNNNNNNKYRSLKYVVYPKFT